MLYFPDSEKKAGCAWALQLWVTLKVIVTEPQWCTGCLGMLACGSAIIHPPVLKPGSPGSHDWPWPVPPWQGLYPLCSPWPLTLASCPSLPVTSFFHCFASLPCFRFGIWRWLCNQNQCLQVSSTVVSLAVVSLEPLPSSPTSLQDPSCYLYLPGCFLFIFSPRWLSGLSTVSQFALIFTTCPVERPF